MRTVRLGIPCEIMECEGRTPLLPESAASLISEKKAPLSKVEVLVEVGLGNKIGLKNSDWNSAGAVLCQDAASVYRHSDIIFKVKGLFPSEVELVRPGQTIACFHHMAASVEVMGSLLAKEANIVPIEWYPGILAAMSEQAGNRTAHILDKCFGKDWADEHIFFGGARGVVCKAAIYSVVGRNIFQDQIHACDLTEGLDSIVLDSGCFQASKTRFYYDVFSSVDDDELCRHLSQCRILVLAAVSKRGGAPRFLKPRHIDCLPDGAFILQVAIDEGGNIDDEEFRRVTYWSDPVYEVRRNGKVYRVFDVPDIPGVIWPEKSSDALDRACRPLVEELVSTYPAIPEQYLFKGFAALSAR